MSECDIIILSNGPGELTTWVRPVVKTIRELLGEEREKIRISVILSPCPNGTGKEGAIARSFPQIDRVLEEKDFFSFLLFGKTPENWDWKKQGIVLFLGGDQFYTVLISKRLNYKSVIYAEWSARWWQFIDHFALMQPTLINNIPSQYKNKCTVVGDLMQNVAEDLRIKENNTAEIIGLLPGSKAAKLAQGVPFGLAIAAYINQKRPQTKFIIPVAPTLDIYKLGKFADLSYNPAIKLINGITGKILVNEEKTYLETETGLKVELITEYPLYDKLCECKICVTTVG
ncbi:MAG TPA: lipid-A-disaccharide synthase, partial [Allocoleopsis sp.]